jgi:shikimate kinase
MTKKCSNPPVNLYLIGFMGVGKSAIGRAVARQLRMEFIDSDAAIESKAGCPISKIFATSGEAEFRKMEREFIARGHPDRGAVVACGGGLPCEPGMPELLLTKGVVICLFASTSTILKRTMHNDKRPLLNVEDPAERIRDLLNKREPIYKETGIGISAEGRTIQDVVKNVVRVYRRESANWQSTGVQS